VFNATFNNILVIYIIPKLMGAIKGRLMDAIEGKLMGP
jgi:hypothetical protein